MVLWTLSKSTKQKSSNTSSIELLGLGVVGGGVFFFFFKLCSWCFFVCLFSFLFLFVWFFFWQYEIIIAGLFRGMTVSSGSVTLKKDTQNLIGISIGGGAPLCPCLYVVQVFDNTPAAKDAHLAAGDEIVGVNGQSVKGRTKVEVARLIQSVKVCICMYACV